MKQSTVNPFDSTSRFLLPLLLLLGLAAAPSLPAAPEFVYLGDLSGGSVYSVARAVSADGTYVVGDSSSTGSGITGEDIETGEASPTEAFIWDEASGMVGLGDLGGGFFHSSALDVSADGQYVVGTSSNSTRGTAAFRWFRGPPATRTAIVSLPSGGRTTSSARATSISSAGDVAVGWGRSVTVIVIDKEVFEEVTLRAFRWTGAGVVWMDETPNSPGARTAAAISPNGVTMVGDYALDIAIPPGIYRTVGAFVEHIGQVDGLATSPAAVTADGRTIVGGYQNGGFVWTENAVPGIRTLPVPAVGISANGRLILDAAGGLYMDGEGPHDLREILADGGEIDLRALSPSQFRATAISDDGFTCVGSAVEGVAVKAWRVRFSDSDGNGLPDEVEEFICGIQGDSYLTRISQGSNLFADLRETTGYGDMLRYYGRPWKRGAGRVPERDDTQPAEFLRAVLLLGGCPDGGGIDSEALATQFLAGVAFPAVAELHDYEMLLGNEALADALDPTIGLDGIPPDDVSDEFAFKGVAGIQDLLDEELALLRGRELPGVPADWVNEATYYPEFTAPGETARGVAVYNRLPPNAAGANAAAYRSNYAAADNFEAAGKFPQGQGDAHGHYLTALRAAIELLRDGPEALPAPYFGLLTGMAASDGAGLDLVGRLAEAATARAGSAMLITDLLFRRDYRENPDDPRTAQLFSDPDRTRAWSMGEWARRGALGAYFDWALAAHWAPTDENRPLHRGNMPELEELSGAVTGFQERLDCAGSGLDPLGLVQNVVPFGIDASGLEPGSGRSHYEQVRDAAARALENARKAFEAANQAGQRLRDSDKAFSDFSERLEDTRADHDQQLIEICGLPSADDPRDNDLDPATGDFEESQSHPDLTNFLATDADLAARGMRPRSAPGQIQLALSELRVAGLRLDQAGLALDELGAQIRSKLERIELLAQVQAERIQIVSTSCDQQVALTRRLEDIEEAANRWGLIKSFAKAAYGAATGNPDQALEFIKNGLGWVAEKVVAGRSDDKYDIEVERQRVQCWKELGLQGLEHIIIVDAEKRELAALLRRSPQLMIDQSAAAEVVVQALGRLQQSVSRAQLLVKERQRLVARTEGDLRTERWKDMSFRVFRNAVLKNYRGFFDIAARYVVLAARAYAYEFDTRSDGDDVLAGIYRERRLGSAAGLEGGLQGVLTRLEGAVTINNFNRPLETLGERSFSFRRNLLGIGVQDFPNDDLRFRAFLESSIMERVEDLSEVRDLAQVSAQRDFGPAIVLPFSTEIDGRNFFGLGPELPYGNANFSITRNAKIRSYAIRFDGVETALGIDPESGTVFVYLLPTGDSVLRENTNLPVIEDELITPWAVIDQFLPAPPLAAGVDLTQRSYSPWRSNAQASGNFLNEIKRQRDSEAQVELGQPLRFNTNLAGRSAWNTRWLLVIPGSQWTASSDPAEIRRKLLQFIYGTRADPAEHFGITDIRWIIQAYSH
jgi:hypothetical protein